MGPRTPGSAKHAMAALAAPPVAALAPPPPAPPAVARPVLVPDYASPESPAALSVSAQRLRFAARMLNLAAILTFLVSLALPALEYRDGWATRDSTLPGWCCLLFGVPFYPSALRFAPTATTSTFSCSASRTAPTRTASVLNILALMPGSGRGPGMSLRPRVLLLPPELMRGKELVGSQALQAKFLRELSRPRLDLARLEDLIRQDLSLTYKLLRYLTSSGLATREGFPSVRDALTKIGEASVRKWGALAAPASGGRALRSELTIMSLVRARFCEVATRWTCTTMGLLSYIDAVAGLPMEHVLSQLGVSHDVKAVLLQDPGAKRELCQIQALAQACERGAWAKVIELCAGCGSHSPNWRSSTTTR